MLKMVPINPSTCRSRPFPILGLIFKFVLEQAEKPLPDRTETLAAFEKIDPERRPLFAYFMADAIKAGRDVRQFDAARLLDDVINRARDKFWKPAGATGKEERLLALATMTRGLPVRTVDDLKEKLLPSWDVDLHPAAFLAMTGRELGETISDLSSQISSASISRSPASRNPSSLIATAPVFARSRGASARLAWRNSCFLPTATCRNHAMLPFVPQIAALQGRTAALLGNGRHQSDG